MTPNIPAPTGSACRMPKKNAEASTATPTRHFTAKRSSRMPRNVISSTSGGTITMPISARRRLPWPTPARESSIHGATSSVRVIAARENMNCTTSNPATTNQ